MKTAHLVFIGVVLIFTIGIIYCVVPQLSEKTAKSTNISASNKLPAVYKDELAEYTDTQFGFSFYYPKGWTIDRQGTRLSIKNPKMVEKVTDKSDPNWPGDDGEMVSITEVTASHVETEDLFSTYNYAFDPSTNKWVYSEKTEGEGVPNGLVYIATTTPPIKGTTVGSLPEYEGGSLHGSGTTIVPLSGNKVLILESKFGASSLVSAFAGTIFPKGAQPSEAQALTAFQAELNDHYYNLP